MPRPTVEQAAEAIFELWKGEVHHMERNAEERLWHSAIECSSRASAYKEALKCLGAQIVAGPSIVYSIQSNDKHE